MPPPPDGGALRLRVPLPPFFPLTGGVPAAGVVPPPEAVGNRATGLMTARSLLHLTLRGRKTAFPNETSSFEASTDASPALKCWKNDI